MANADARLHPGEVTEMTLPQAWDSFVDRWAITEPRRLTQASQGSRQNGARPFAHVSDHLPWTPPTSKSPIFRSRKGSSM